MLSVQNDSTSASKMASANPYMDMCFVNNYTNDEYDQRAFSPVLQTLPGVGILRMSAYVDDPDSDLICEEINKLTANSRNFEVSAKSELGCDGDTCSPSNELSSLNSNTSSPIKLGRKSRKSSLVKSVMENLSPRLPKKMRDKENAVKIPSGPVWPNSMATYARGVSEHGTQSYTTPEETSLVALRVQDRLERSSAVRNALQSLHQKSSSDIDDINESFENNDNITETKSVERNDNYIETKSFEKHDNNQSPKSNTINVIENKSNSTSKTYQGQSPFDDDFDPRIHKPTVLNCNIFNTFRDDNLNEIQSPTSPLENQSSFQFQNSFTNSFVDNRSTLDYKNQNSTRPFPGVRVSKSIYYLDGGAPTTSVFV